MRLVDGDSSATSARANEKCVTCGDHIKPSLSMSLFSKLRGFLTCTHFVAQSFARELFFFIK
jgi:hypothetical protein